MRKLYEDNKEDLIESLIENLSSELMVAIDSFQGNYPDIDVYDLVDMVQNSVGDLGDQIYNQATSSKPKRKIDYTKYIVHELKDVYWIYDNTKEGINDYLTGQFDLKNLHWISTRIPGYYQDGGDPARKVTLKGNFLVVSPLDDLYSDLSEVQHKYGQDGVDAFNNIIPEIDLVFDKFDNGTFLNMKSLDKNKFSNIQIIDKKEPVFNIIEISSLHKYDGPLEDEKMYYISMSDADKFLRRGVNLKNIFPSSIYNNYAIPVKSSIFFVRADSSLKSQVMETSYKDIGELTELKRTDVRVNITLYPHIDIAREGCSYYTPGIVFKKERNDNDYHPEYSFEDLSSVILYTK